MRWGSKGFPKEIDMLNNLKVVFTVSAFQISLYVIFKSDCLFSVVAIRRLSKMMKETEVILETEQNDQSLSTL